MISMRIFGTRVRVKIIVLVIIATLWGGVTWLGLYWHPDRGFWQGLLIGSLSAILLLIADFGHALAHIFSARYAGAPMDEILIAAGMPRTIYWNNQVPPNVHRMRALGGPIFNMLGLVLSLAIFGIASSNSITKELAGWSASGHGLLLIRSLSANIHRRRRHNTEVDAGRERKNRKGSGRDGSTRRLGDRNSRGNNWCRNNRHANMDRRPDLGRN